MTGAQRKPTKAKQVETLAASIRDLSHFEEIMATVDPKMRREVRQLLQSYVTFDVPEPDPLGLAVSDPVKYRAVPPWVDPAGIA